MNLHKIVLIISMVDTMAKCSKNWMIIGNERWNQPNKSTQELDFAVTRSRILSHLSCVAAMDPLKAAQQIAKVE